MAFIFDCRPPFSAWCRPRPVPPRVRPLGA